KGRVARPRHWAREPSPFLSVWSQTSIDAVPVAAIRSAWSFLPSPFASRKRNCANPAGTATDNTQIAASMSENILIRSTFLPRIAEKPAGRYLWIVWVLASVAIVGGE